MELRPALARTVIALAVLGCAVAARGETNRFHRLTPQLLGKLRPASRRTALGVGELRQASSFVAHRDGGQRALLLTNHHVAGSGVTVGEPITFVDGATARTVRLVASNPALDYALVEIELPPGSQVPALPLERGGFHPGRPIYSVAAHANLYFTYPAKALGGGPQANAAILRGPTNQFAIASGHVDRNSIGAVTINTTGNKQITGVVSMLPNSSGMSGSPVLASDTYRVIGLHSSGNGQPNLWVETSVPISLILQDVEWKLKSGNLDPSSVPLVDAMLRATP